MSRPNDAHSAERRFLGLEGAPDDRALLGLPDEGPLKSGQIEAALERRIDEVARHPLAGSPEARRLLAHLEGAADRLQQRGRRERRRARAHGDEEHQQRARAEAKGHW